MKQISYRYESIDKILIILLIMWSLYTLFGHTLIHVHYGNGERGLDHSHENDTPHTH